MFYSFTITFLTLSNKSFFEISRLIEASPMELATINLIIPESIFLSFKVASTTSLALISDVSIGNLYNLSTSNISWYWSLVIKPFLYDMYDAALIPIETHSPCKREKFFVFSIAWPIVWPKLSSARSPFSFGSFSTTHLFILQQHI